MGPNWVHLGLKLPLCYSSCPNLPWQTGPEELVPLLGFYTREELVLQNRLNQDEFYLACTASICRKAYGLRLVIGIIGVSKEICYFSFVKVHSERGTTARGSRSSYRVCRDFSERWTQAFSCTVKHQETRRSKRQRQINSFSTPLLILGSFLVLRAFK